MSQVVLFIDGENFIKKIEGVFRDSSEKAPSLNIYNFEGLFKKVLQGLVIDRKIFYFAKLAQHPDTPEKSKQLIEKRRALKTHLEKLGFEVVIKGNVRGQLEKDKKGKEVLVFKEKGVDVKIAVDMVTMGCDGAIKTAILGSSDSDLQPAVEELEKRGVERIYLGFETSPNKGLTFTTNRTILIRNSEVLEFRGKTLI